MPGHHADHVLQPCKWSLESHENIGLEWADEVPVNLIFRPIECSSSASEELDPHSLDNRMDKGQWVTGLPPPGSDWAP